MPAHCKQFQCQACNKRFQYKISLKHHQCPRRPDNTARCNFKVITKVVVRKRKISKCDEMDSVQHNSRGEKNNRNDETVKSCTTAKIQPNIALDSTKINNYDDITKTQCSSKVISPRYSRSESNKSTKFQESPRGTSAKCISPSPEKDSISSRTRHGKKRNATLGSTGNTHLCNSAGRKRKSAHNDTWCKDVPTEENQPTVAIKVELDHQEGESTSVVVSPVRMLTRSCYRANKDNYACGQCSETFLVLDDLEKHYLTHIKEESDDSENMPSVDTSVNAGDATESNICEKCGHLCVDGNFTFHKCIEIEDHCNQLQRKAEPITDAASRICKDCSKVFQHSEGLKNHKCTCSKGGTVRYVLNDDGFFVPRLDLGDMTNLKVFTPADVSISIPRISSVYSLSTNLGRKSNANCLRSPKSRRSLLRRIVCNYCKKFYSSCSMTKYKNGTYCCVQCSVPSTPLPRKITGTDLRKLSPSRNPQKLPSVDITLDQDSNHSSQAQKVRYYLCKKCHTMVLADEKMTKPRSGIFICAKCNYSGKNCALPQMPETETQEHPTAKDANVSKKLDYLLCTTCKKMCSVNSIGVHKNFVCEDCSRKARLAAQIDQVFGNSSELDEQSKNGTSATTARILPENKSDKQKPKREANKKAKRNVQVLKSGKSPAPSCLEGYRLCNVCHKLCCFKDNKNGLCEQCSRKARLSEQIRRVFDGDSNFDKQAKNGTGKHEASDSSTINRDKSQEKKQKLGFQSGDSPTPSCPPVYRLCTICRHKYCCLKESDSSKRNLCEQCYRKERLSEQIRQVFGDNSDNEKHESNTTASVVSETSDKSQYGTSATVRNSTMDKQLNDNAVQPHHEEKKIGNRPPIYRMCATCKQLSCPKNEIRSEGTYRCNECVRKYIAIKSSKLVSCGDASDPFRLKKRAASRCDILGKPMTVRAPTCRFRRCKRCKKVSFVDRYLDKFEEENFLCKRCEKTRKTSRTHFQGRVSFSPIQSPTSSPSKRLEMNEYYISDIIRGYSTSNTKHAIMGNQKPDSKITRYYLCKVCKKMCYSKKKLQKHKAQNLVCKGCHRRTERTRENSESNDVETSYMIFQKDSERNNLVKDYDSQQNEDKPTPILKTVKFRKCSRCRRVCDTEGRLEKFGEDNFLCERCEKVIVNLSLKKRRRKTWKPLYEGFDILPQEHVPQQYARQRSTLPEKRHPEEYRHLEVPPDHFTVRQCVVCQKYISSQDKPRNGGFVCKMCRHKLLSGHPEADESSEADPDSACQAGEEFSTVEEDPTSPGLNDHSDNVEKNESHVLTASKKPLIHVISLRLPIHDGKKPRISEKDSSSTEMSDVPVFRSCVRCKRLFRTQLQMGARSVTTPICKKCSDDVSSERNLHKPFSPVVQSKSLQVTTKKQYACNLRCHNCKKIVSSQGQTSNSHKGITLCSTCETLSATSSLGPQHHEKQNQRELTKDTIQLCGICKKPFFSRRLQKCQSGILSCEACRAYADVGFQSAASVVEKKSASTDKYHLCEVCNVMYSVPKSSNGETAKSNKCTVCLSLLQTQNANAQTSGSNTDQSDTRQEQTIVSESVEGDIIYTCLLCRDVMTSQVDLEAHMKQHGRDSSVSTDSSVVQKQEVIMIFTCELCRSVVSSFENLEMHMKEHEQASE